MPVPAVSPRGSESVSSGSASVTLGSRLLLISTIFSPGPTLSTAIVDTCEPVPAEVGLATIGAAAGVIARPSRLIAVMRS